MWKWGSHQEGYSLVEVVAAMAILTAVLVPMLNFVAYGYNQRAYQKQMAATVAALKLEEWQNENYRKNPITHKWYDPTSAVPMIGSMEFECTLSMNEVGGTDSIEQRYLKQATVTCACTTCRHPDPQTVVGYLARIKTDAETVADPDAE